MLLADLFEQLNYGELSQISLAGASEMGISASSYPALVTYINLGVKELYKRFPINVIELEIITNDVTLSYPIIATDILAITEIVSDKLGHLKINGSDEKNSIKLVNNSELVLLKPLSQLITIIYRTIPDRIDINNLDPNTTIVNIPPVLEEALLYYVGARALAVLTNLDGNSNDSLTYMQKFENSITKVKEHGLIEHVNPSNNKLDRNGWV